MNVIDRGRQIDLRQEQAGPMGRDPYRQQSKLTGLWTRRSDGSLRTQVMRNMGVSLVVRVFSMGGGLLMQLVLARLLGLTEFGLYTYAWASMLTLLIIGKMGFEFSSIRFVADYHTQQEWGLLRGFMLQARWLVLGMTVFAALGAAIALQALLRTSRLEPETVQVFGVALVVMPIWGIAEVQSGILRGANRLSIALFTQNAMLPLGIALLAPLLLLIDGARTAVGALVISAVVALITVSLQFAMIRCVIPRAAGRVVPVFQTRAWLKVSGAMMLSTGVEQLMRQLDVIVVGTLIGAAATGVYAVAARFARLINIGLQISNQSTAHMYTPLYRQGRQAELQKVVSFTALVTMLTTIPLVLLLFFFPDPILTLFGESFSQQGTVALQILLVGQSANAIAGPNGVLMYMTRYQNEMIFILVTTLLIDLLLMLLLIPHLGLAGVAVAVSVAAVFRNAATVWRVRRHLGIDTTIFAPTVWRQLAFRASNQ